MTTYSNNDIKWFKMIFNDILSNDIGIIIVFLDLSEAFGTLNH